MPRDRPERRSPCDDSAARTQRVAGCGGRCVWGNRRRRGLLPRSLPRTTTTLYWASRHATRSILISGWEFDRTVPLLRGADVPVGEDVRFLKFLNGLCERKPKLYVCHALARRCFLSTVSAQRASSPCVSRWLRHECCRIRGALRSLVTAPQMRARTSRAGL
jgi:hypothetical protein